MKEKFQAGAKGKAMTAGPREDLRAAVRLLRLWLQQTPRSSLSILAYYTIFFKPTTPRSL